MLALFALLRLDPQRLWLLLPDAEPEALAVQLRRFVFRSKLAIEARPDLAVAAAFAADAQARGAVLALRGTDSVAMDFGGDGGARTVSIVAAAGTAPDAIAVPADAAAVDAWRAFDLAHGLPRLGDGQVDRWTPQQLSLDRLRAYSVKKGCYPGQEIVARTHFLGQAKRGLVLLEGDAPLAPEAAVHMGGTASGHLVCTAGPLALAVLPLEREHGGAIQVDGAAVRERPLLDGLAR